MERAAFAVFRSRQAAEQAKDALVGEGIPEELIHVQLHESDLPRRPTVSHSHVWYAIPIVIVLGATAGALMAGRWGLWLGLLFAAYYGTLAAALSGKIDLEPVIAKLVSKVRERRRTMMVIDIGGVEGAGIDHERFLVQHGTVRVGMT
jgi:hypothetical protein